jgi:hypothetical protein
MATDGAVTAGDRARDLRADLVLCDAARPGPWYAYHPSEFPGDIRIAWGHGRGTDGVAGGYLCRLTHSHSRRWSGGAGRAHDDPRDEDAAFIAAAREGWPAAIRRALAAEAELERLRRKGAAP